MLSPETGINRAPPIEPLIAKELRDLASGRAFWVMLVFTSLLVGASFEQAVALYSEASRTAAQTPLLATRLSPFDGIMVPTFGALYLAATFLLPFVVIRIVSAERASGAIKLALQLPYSEVQLIGAKLAAAFTAWGAMALVPLSAVVSWRLLGGHVGPAETANLLAGHFVYALVIVGIALVCAAISDNAATAAILAPAVTIGFWVLEFAAIGQGGILQGLAEVSPTRVLRGFERGLFSTGPALVAIAAAAALIATAAIWLQTGRSMQRKLTLSVAVALGAVVLALTGTLRPLYLDMTENSRNSMRPSQEAGLRQLTDTLGMLVRLAPEDPRLIDFERGLLGKLRRIVPRIKVTIESDSRSAPIENADERYGEMIYKYQGHEAVSRSTASGEVVPLIFELAGVTPPKLPPRPRYPGYPLIADAAPVRAWFTFVLPLLIALAWLAAAGRWPAWAKTSHKSAIINRGD